MPVVSHSSHFSPSLACSKIATWRIRNQPIPDLQLQFQFNTLGQINAMVNARYARIQEGKLMFTNGHKPSKRLHCVICLNHLYFIVPPLLHILWLCSPRVGTLLSFLLKCSQHFFLRFLAKCDLCSHKSQVIAPVNSRAGIGR